MNTKVWHAIVHLVISPVDCNGNELNTEAEVSDYIVDVLDGEFLDWSYVNGTSIEKIFMTVPYEEGSFLARIKKEMP
jgi:hypothetical protein